MDPSWMPWSVSEESCADRLSTRISSEHIIMGLRVISPLRRRTNFIRPENLEHNNWVAMPRRAKTSKNLQATCVLSVPLQCKYQPTPTTRPRWPVLFAKKRRTDTALEFRKWVKQHHWRKPLHMCILLQDYYNKANVRDEGLHRGPTSWSCWATNSP